MNDTTVYTNKRDFFSPSVFVSKSVDVLHFFFKGAPVKLQSTC